MNKYFCDFCKKEISEVHHAVTLEEWANDQKIEVCASKMKFDCCDECFTKVKTSLGIK